MTLPIQADAIRVAILQKYGGFWMDADNLIINSNFITMFNKSDLQMFGNSQIKKLYTGFIYGTNNSIILKIWLKSIIKRIKIYKFRLFLKRIFPTKYNIKIFNELGSWDYLGNGIINELVSNASEKDFKLIEQNVAYALPEQIFLNGTLVQRYIDFYFTKKDRTKFIKNCKGILMLHNSWTPQKYKIMSVKEFMSQDIMLSHLIKKLLKNNI